MAKINLLPWRDELREKRKKEFIVFCVAAAAVGVLASGFGVVFLQSQNCKIKNKPINWCISTNQNLDVQLKSLEGLQEQRNAIVERMKLIQGLQSQRPIAVRLVDELRACDTKQYVLNQSERTGNKFTFEGKAESPNTVAEFLRNLEASPWYRNAFMNSFLAKEENKDKAPSSVVPRVEESLRHYLL